MRTYTHTNPITKQHIYTLKLIQACGPRTWGNASGTMRPRTTLASVMAGIRASGGRPSCLPYATGPGYAPTLSGPTTNRPSRNMSRLPPPAPHARCAHMREAEGSMPEQNAAKHGPAACTRLLAHQSSLQSGLPANGPAITDCELPTPCGQCTRELQHQQT